MRPSQPSKRRTWLRLLPMLLGLILMAAACAPSTVAPLSTPAPGAAPATGAPATNAAAQPAGSGSDLQAGVDADGNFYRGDPNAAVKLTEYSDFQ